MYACMLEYSVLVDHLSQAIHTQCGVFLIGYLPIFRQIDKNDLIFHICDKSYTHTNFQVSLTIDNKYRTYVLIHHHHRISRRTSTAGDKPPLQLPRLEAVCRRCFASITSLIFSLLQVVTNLIVVSEYIQ